MRISDWSSDVCSSDLADFDAAVALAVGLARLGHAFKLRFAIAHRRHPGALDAAGAEVIGDRRGAAFGQTLVIAVAARRIGVAVDVDIGARIFAEGRGDAVERATELALQHRAVEVEGDVSGHVEDELVALALDVDAGAGGAFAQLLFLLVHVIACARARDGSDARPGDLFGASVHAGDQVVERNAARRNLGWGKRMTGGEVWRGTRDNTQKND